MNLFRSPAGTNTQDFKYIPMYNVALQFAGSDCCSYCWPIIPYLLAYTQQSIGLVIMSLY